MQDAGDSRTAFQPLQSSANALSTSSSHLYLLIYNSYCTASYRHTTNTATAVMVQSQDVKVTVMRYGDNEPYPEYELAKDATNGFSNAKEAYIEVVPGDRFIVMVTILSTFDFQFSSHVRISCSADGRCPKHYFRSREEVKKTLSATVNPRQSVTWEDNSRKIDGRGMKCGSFFAELQLGM